uniref:ADP/ATP translocase n=1 Tax=Parascaris equorum TaxID=6256 RepID=A0A914RAP9_PAREQ
MDAAMFFVLLCGCFSIMLFSGFWPSLQYIFLYRGAYYGLFDSAKVLISKKENSQISFMVAFLVGQVVTFTAARLMMQAGRNDILYRGVWHCTKKIYYEEGVRAFFSGMLVNMVRGTGAALILAIYNEFSKYM